MEKLIYFVQNHSINHQLIMNDTAPYAVIILAIFCFLVWQVAKDYRAEVKQVRQELQYAESRIEDKSAEIFAANHVNDSLSAANVVLIQKLQTAEKKLEKYNYQRDAKWHFVSKKSQPKAVENV